MLEGLWAVERTDFWGAIIGPFSGPHAFWRSLAGPLRSRKLVEVDKCFGKIGSFVNFPVLANSY